MNHMTGMARLNRKAGERRKTLLSIPVTNARSHRSACTLGRQPNRLLGMRSRRLVASLEKIERRELAICGRMV